MKFIVYFSCVGDQDGGGSTECAPLRAVYVFKQCVDRTHLASASVSMNVEERTWYRGNSIDFILCSYLSSGYADSNQRG